MPARLIVVYVLMLIRALANGAIMVRFAGPHTAPEKALFGLAAIEFCFSVFILVCLSQRKYLAISVFRPYVLVSGCIAVAAQIFAAQANERSGAPMPYAQPVGGGIFLAFLFWFQWYVANPAVRAYLGRAAAQAEPPVLPASAEILPPEPNPPPIRPPDDPDQPVP
jgi:hypothetical protein